MQNNIFGKSIIIKIVYLTIITGFFGATFFSVPLGPITLFPYRVLIVLLLISVSLIILKEKKIYYSHIKVKNYLFFLFIWFIYALFSVSWAKSKVEAFREIGYLIFVFSIIFFVVYFFTKLENHKCFYKIWIGVLIFMVLLGVWEVITGNHLPGSKLYKAAPHLKHIPTGVFVNQNDYATYLTLSFPFLLNLFKFKKKYMKIIALCLLVISLYLIIATQSRANYLAFILGLLFWFSFNINIKNKIKYLFFGLLFSVGLIFIFPDLLINLINTIREQLSSIFINYIKFKEGKILSSIGVRVNLIRNSLMFLLDSFGFGVGPGNAKYYMKINSYYNTSHIVSVHNWWIEILTNYGILIFVGYVLFYLNIIKDLFIITKSSNNIYESMIVESLLISLVMFLVSSLSSSSIVAFKPQWILFAFAISFINYYRLKNH